MASSDKRYIRDPRISWRLIEGEAVLIDRDEGEVLRLNPVGTEIWQGLDGGRTVNELIDGVEQTFEVERKWAQRDVLNFIRQLVRRELVTETDGREAS